MVLILAVFCVFLDQITKYGAVKYLKNKSAYKIIDGFFHLYYVENRGAAFGILQERRTLFLILTGIVLIGLLVILYKYHSDLNIFSKIAFGLLLGGAVGNLIDRIRLSYVVDFISFRFGKYSFPVFNIADICIVLATIMIMGIVIFQDIKDIE